MEQLNTLSLMDRIPDEAAAYEYLEQLRWNGKPVCPHCGNDDRCYFLTPRAPRTTSTGAVTHRRLWKCAECRKKFSVTTGTVMHGSKIAIRIWVLVMFELCSAKNGIAAREIERRYGLTPKSAWFLLHRLREIMKRGGLVETLSGTIVVDETYIGGLTQNKHHNQRKPGSTRPSAIIPDKSIVLSLIDTATGEVRSKVITDVSGGTVAKAIAAQVDMSRTTLWTDGGPWYRHIAQQFVAHEWVDHKGGEYVRGPVTTNNVEGFFSQLKRSLDGTHHRVSFVHLDRYLAEFDFRWTTRKMTDTERMHKAIGQMPNRRLSYRPLIAA